MAHGDQVAEQRPGNGPEPAGEGARSSSPSPTQRELLLLSVLALFLELLIIRWLATEVRIFAYFKNLPLMSAFLGLGLGFLWTDRKRDYFHWSAPGLLSLSMLLIFALGLGLTYLSFVDPLKFLLFGVRTAGDGHRLAPMWTTLRSLAIMLGIFALSTSIFVGLGQRMGKLFDRLPPLTAYSINIAGSLIGSLLFTGLSWMRTGPGVWLVAAGLMLTVLNRRVAHFAVIVLGILYALSLGPYIARANYGADYVKTVWSPYYRIDVAAVRQPGGPWRGEKLGYNIYINYDSFQSILDCSPASLSRFPRDVQEKLRATFDTLQGAAQTRRQRPGAGKRHRQRRGSGIALRSRSCRCGGDRPLDRGDRARAASRASVPVEQGDSPCHGRAHVSQELPRQIRRHRLCGAGQPHGLLVALLPAPGQLHLHPGGDEPGSAPAR